MRNDKRAECYWRGRATSEELILALFFEKLEFFLKSFPKPLVAHPDRKLGFLDATIFRENSSKIPKN